MIGKNKRDDIVVRLMSVDEFAAYMGIGRNNALKVGAEIGAEIRIGKRRLYDKNVVDAWIDRRIKDDNI